MWKKKIVSLLYNKEKASNAFFGTNVNKSVYLFVYGFRLTFAVFMDGDLPNSKAFSLLYNSDTIFFFHIDPTFYSLNVECLWANQGGCRAKWDNCIPQDIDTSCRYDNDPRWFPQAMYVTESHHIVLIKFSHLNRTTSTYVLKLSPLQVAKFDICTLYK
jgi:hypothetical protein